MKILILHLSDLHLKESLNSCEIKIDAISAAVRNEEADLAAALVVVSGDIAYSGKPE
jgi:hypothetical protein